MEFLNKKDIMELANNPDNIYSACDIVNFHDQRVCYIHLNPINGLEYTIAGFKFGYDIMVNRDKEPFRNKEVLYKYRFDIFKLLWLKKIAKNYDRLEQLKRLKKISEVR